MHALEAGVDAIHIREPWFSGSELESLVREVVRLAAGTPTRVLVNDRIDVALACGANGAHLRGDSPAPSAVRAIVPQGFLLGRSVHDVGDARAVARWVDYLIAGTVWSTASKAADHQLIGLDGLHEIVKAVDVPVLAIGGITLERLRLVSDVGAAGAAAIGLFMKESERSHPGQCRAISVRRIVECAHGV